MKRRYDILRMLTLRKHRPFRDIFTEIAQVLTERELYLGLFCARPHRHVNPGLRIEGQLCVKLSRINRVLGFISHTATKTFRDY